ncbi:M23 family metallopeptidase [Streptomyces sp. NPDC003077]|uniref:M23 family metallopeptidase n=1 Tax=Streptomyces sp. NPDC003077 TaxID=3154443 RepID=UPI0033A4EF53
MSKHAIFRSAKSSAVRTRAAVLVAGVGVTAAMGAGVATAAESNSGGIALSGLSASITDTINAQADAQSKAAGDAKKAQQDAKQAAEKKAASWVKPVDSYVMGAKFGRAGTHWAHNHSGQDFVVPTGTAVKAVHQGTVIKAGPNGGGDGPAYGNAIVIEHNGHTYTQYAHLSRIEVRVGQKVATGQEIAKSGSTGNSTGPHLHFEVRTGPNYGSGIEPTGFLKRHDDAV